jgi:hypothetical protein
LNLPALLLDNFSVTPPEGLVSMARQPFTNSNALDWIEDQKDLVERDHVDSMSQSLDNRQE